MSNPGQCRFTEATSASYHMVASDGGIFAFGVAKFFGSMGDRFGEGYLMVGTDGGILNFSNQPFFGSLGADPPAYPIASVAVLAR